MTRNTRPEEGHPDELVWLRGYEVARNEFVTENAALTDALRAAREEITRMRNWIRPGYEPTFSWGHKSFLISVATEALAQIDAVLAAQEGK